MKTRNEISRKIAIIGGGVSGVLTAFHLIRQGTPAEIVLIDQRQDLGLGLAYSTPSLRHLLNVPAGKISALPDQPDHFLNWLQRNFDPSATEKTFAPRAVFGRYVQSLLATVSDIRVLQAQVTDVRPQQSGALIILNDDRKVHADFVVLATGNFDPAPLPGISKEAVLHDRYHHNAWSENTYRGLPKDAPIAIIGTGLTGVDVVLRLRELGHAGKIIAVSRHGIFPNGHQDYTPMQQSAIPLNTAPTAIAYLRSLRNAIRAGAEWRAAVDSLRATTNQLWQRLPLNEQKRFRRHLQRRWDVVRHRMAPSIAAIIEAEISNGTLEIREGRLAGVDASTNGAHVSVHDHNGTYSFEVNRVINCTGPSMNYRRVQSELMRSLFDRGLASPGPLGGGFHCTADGALIGANGVASDVIYNLGPGRLGDLIESIAVPEIRQQAADLAKTLNARLDTLADQEDRAALKEREAEWVAA